MRRVRVVLGAAAVACAFSALTAPAFAHVEKPKAQFGEFVASVAGQNLATEPGILKLHENEAEVEELKLGPYTFGKNANEEVCSKDLGVTGEVTAERSPTLFTELKFKKCNTAVHEGGFRETKAVNFTLAVKFHANNSAEIGAGGTGIEIVQPSVVHFKGALRKCIVEIPAQFVPGHAGEKPEVEYESADYSNESEPVENFEKSKKLKEEYPSGVKERMEIELEFKKIVTYVKPEKSCEYEKGTEGKYITEGPHAGYVEYSNGLLTAELDELEVKEGELKFEPPA